MFSSIVRSPYKLNRCDRYPTLSATRPCSRTGLKPRTRTRPASAWTRPQISRIVVVFPAPSGPIKPNISPGATLSDSSDTAMVSPYLLVTRSRMMASGISLLQRYLRLDRHSGFQHTGAVVHSDLHAIHELRPVLGCLHVARSELGLCRDVADGARHPCSPRIGEHGARLSNTQTRHDWLVDEHIRPRVIQIGDDDNGRARLNELARIDELLRDDTGDGSRDNRIGDRLLPARDLGVGGGHTRTRGVDLFGARPCTQAREILARRAHPFVGALQPLIRHVAPRH